MSNAELDRKALGLVRDILRGGLTQAQAAGRVKAFLSTLVLMNPLGLNSDILDAYEALHKVESDTIHYCTTCGWTPTEPHPRREGINRCSNCKEYRVRLTEQNTPDVADCIRDHQCAAVGEGPCNGWPRS